MSFRIQANSDGSFGIFNPSTNQYLCKIPSPKFPPQLKRVILKPLKTNVTRALSGSSSKKTPRLAKASLASLQITDRSSSKNVSKYGRRLVQRIQSEKVYKDSDSESISSSSTLRTSTTSDMSTISSLTHSSVKSDLYHLHEHVSDDEPDEDCIDNIVFMRMLNLVQSELLKSGILPDALKDDFPVRLVNKRNPFKKKEELQKKQAKYLARYRQKVTEKNDISSPLVQMILRKTNKCFYSEDATSKLVTRYERYCIPSAKVTQFSKRDMRVPVTYKEKIMKGNHYKFYTFTNKERREHYNKCRTGLNRASRRLLASCKPVAIRLEKLTDGRPTYLAKRHDIKRVRSSSLEYDIEEQTVQDENFALLASSRQKLTKKETLFLKQEPRDKCLLMEPVVLVMKDSLITPLREDNCTKSASPRTVKIPSESNPSLNRRLLRNQLSPILRSCPLSGESSPKVKRDLFGNDRSQSSKKNLLRDDKSTNLNGSSSLEVNSTPNRSLLRNDWNPSTKSPFNENKMGVIRNLERPRLLRSISEQGNNKYGLSMGANSEFQRSSPNNLSYIIGVTNNDSSLTRQELQQTNCHETMNGNFLTPDHHCKNTPNGKASGSILRRSASTTKKLLRSSTIALKHESVVVNLFNSKRMSPPTNNNTLSKLEVQCNDDPSRNTNNTSNLDVHGMVPNGLPVTTNISKRPRRTVPNSCFVSERVMNGINALSPLSRRQAIRLISQGYLIGSGCYSQGDLISSPGKFLDSSDLKDTSIILEDVLFSLRRKFKRWYYLGTNLSVKLPNSFLDQLPFPVRKQLLSNVMLLEKQP